MAGMAKPVSCNGSCRKAVTQVCAELLMLPGCSTGAEQPTEAQTEVLGACKALRMRKVLWNNQGRTAWIILFQNLVMRAPPKPHRSWCCLRAAVLPYRAHQLR